MNNKQVKKKRNTGLIILGVIAAICLIGGVVLLFNSAASTTNRDPVLPPAHVGNAVPSVPSHAAAFDSLTDAQKAVQAAQEAQAILRLAGKNPLNESKEDRIARIGRGDYSGVDAALLPRIHVVGVVQGQDVYKNGLAGLVGLAEAIKDQGNTEFELLKTPSVEQIHIDGTEAIVPSSVFLPTSPFLIDMGYRQGQWKWLPLGLVNEALLSGRIQQEVKATPSDMN